MATETTTAYVKPMIRVKQANLTDDQIKQYVTERNALFFGALRSGIDSNTIGKKGIANIAKGSIKLMESIDTTTRAEKNYFSVDLELVFESGDKKPYSYKIQTPDELKLISESEKLNFLVGEWLGLTNAQGQPIAKLLLSADVFDVEDKVKAENQAKLDAANANA